MPGLLRNVILEKTKCLEFHLRVSFQEIYNGGTRTLAVTRNRKCDECDGRGTQSIIPENVICEECHGGGPECGLCWGDGLVVIPEDRCVFCRGQRVQSSVHALVVTIRPGVKHGQKIIYIGEGTQEPNKRVGDIAIIFAQEKNQIFRRIDNDLLTDIALTANESLLGFRKLVSTLDNRRLSIRANEGVVTPNNTLRCVLNEGMPLYTDPTRKGRLIIRFKVNGPMDAVEGVMANVALNDNNGDEQ